MIDVQKIISHAAPATVPSVYLGIVDFLSDPAKFAGFIVLVLQGIYIGIKIYKEWEGKNNDPIEE